MYFEDLSPYCYYASENCWYEFVNDCDFEKILNVGWLDSDHSFPTGTVEAASVRRLRELICCSLEGIDIHVCQTRGLHPCNLCGKYPKLRSGDGNLYDLGGSELWIPSADRKTIFAAPEMVIHYIEEHSYLPPVEFLDALRDFDESQTFNGEILGEKMIERRQQ